MNYPILLLGAIRLDALRALPELVGSQVRRLGTTVPKAAPAVAWLRANRRDVAAVATTLLGTLLIAAAGGLV